MAASAPLAFIRRLPAALVVLSLVVLGGCAQCGDAIICPAPAPQDFPSGAVPAVRMDGDTLRFEAPRSLQRHRHYALAKVYVYEALGERVVWQIDSKIKGARLAEMAKYDPRQPLTYGQSIEGTAVTVPAAVLQVGTAYNMRADLIGYDQPGVLSYEYVKVTFRLKRENGPLRVEPLPTRRAG